MAAKDHELVVRFLALFAKLRDWIDDDPESLGTLAENDESVKKICVELERTALDLRASENRERNLFAAPVDPKFVAAWRDYEQRYSYILGMLSLSDLFGVSLDAVISQWPSSGEFERRLKFSTEQAQEAAEAIDSVFLFVEQQIESEEVWIDEEDADELKRGISEWESVRRGAGLDLVGMMRRRSLAPFILVPRHVHRLHGDAEKLSLLTLLRQAQDAFVFGVPFAAIALMRSLLESMLRDHYKAAGVDLKEMINRVVNLPRSVHRASLHKLRRLANSIMHPNKALVEMPAELERDVHEFLLMLRALIESAPPR
jgi:hypothetical protein